MSELRQAHGSKTKNNEGCSKDASTPLLNSRQSAVCIDNVDSHHPPKPPNQTMPKSSQGTDIAAITSLTTMRIGDCERVKIKCYCKQIAEANHDRAENKVELSLAEPNERKSFLNFTTLSARVGCK